MGVEFTPSTGPTLGVEWELGLVDATTMDLVPEAPKVFDALRDAEGDLDPRVHPEFLRNQVELVTGVCRDVGEAVADLSDALALVRSVTDPMGWRSSGPAPTRSPPATSRRSPRTTGTPCCSTAPATGPSRCSSTECTCTSGSTTARRCCRSSTGSCRTTRTRWRCRRPRRTGAGSTPATPATDR